MTQDHEAARSKRSRRGASRGYPEDRFDKPSGGRVGAHRVTPVSKAGWRFVLVGLVSAALLTTAGVVWVTIANSTGTLPDLRPPNQTAGPVKVTPALDPEATVVLLDGTSPSGDVAQRVATAITDEKWGTIIFAGPADNSEVKTSGVFYADPADEAAALGLAQKLGGASSFQSDAYGDYGARLIVLIGTDYGGPGKDPQ